MRKILGGAVLALGVGGLGIYANNNHAERMQTRIAGEASVVAMSSIHRVNTTVSGRDIRVTGYANDAAEHDKLIAALDALEGRRVVIDDLLILEQASPFVFQSTKSANGQTYAGLVPSETVRGAFGKELKGAEAALELKAGVPDDQWDDVVLQALSSMAWLKEGEMSLTDRALVLTGKAATPPEKNSADNLLAELPEGYTADVNITSILPLAEPFVLSSRKSPDGQTYAGVVQNDDGRGVLAAVIGDNANGLVHSFGAPDGNWETVGAKGLAALATLEQGEMNLTDKVLTVTGLATIPPIKAEAEAMLADLPEGYSLVVDIKSAMDAVSPFEIGSVKTASHQAFSGVIPSDEARAKLAPVMGADAAAKLKLAYGAPDGNWVDVAGQGLAALDVLEDGKMSLVDRVLTIEGRGATPVEKAKAEAILAELPEGYSVKTDISAILQISSPYTFRSIKSGSMQSYSGDIPSEEDRAALAKHSAKGVAGLVTSAGVPDDAWTGVAGKSLDALANLDEGKVEIIDRAVMLKGIAQTPTERDAALAALGDLPNGYTLNADITMLDDGSPTAYTIAFDQIKGASVDGKLPKGMSNEAIASALGLRAVSGTPTIGRIGNTDAAVALSKRLNVMSDWLPDFESFSLTSDGTKTTVISKVAVGVDNEQVQASIGKAMGDSVDVAVAGTKIAVEAGTVRETILGEKQVFSGGFWLPVQAQMDATADSCAAESDKILSASKVNFLTASAQLDAKSVRTVNSIAAVMLQCLDGTGLHVEVGGHTDSAGSHAYNVKLSKARAQSVMKELIARGIPADLISAKGFGPDMPIASNDTDEGKAANRRTTIRWYMPVEDAAETTSTGSGDAPTTQVSE